MTELNELLKEFVKNWVAGERLSEAIRVVRRLNKKGLSAMINVLGEHLEKKASVEDMVDEYLRAVDEIKKNNLDASITLKETELGLDIGKGYFAMNLERIVSYASKQNIFVWVDMESHDYIDVTLEVFMKLLKVYSNIGIALQASLKRSENDLTDVASKNGKVRLVKGAYHEDGRVAFQTAKDIIDNYKKLMVLLMS